MKRQQKFSGEIRITSTTNTILCPKGIYSGRKSKEGERERERKRKKREREKLEEEEKYTLTKSTFLIV